MTTIVNRITSAVTEIWNNRQRADLITIMYFVSQMKNYVMIQQ